jgi:3-(3-hydroxy-phenyl)propionate hydroxylase
LITECQVSEEPPRGIQRDEKGTYAIGRLDDGRVRAVLREEQVRSGEPTLDELRQLLTSLYATDFGVHEVSWLSRFSDASRQASRYRAGRVLLAGDAAHVHSPMGGQGLNTGLQDAVNLGWKLAQVVRGISPDGLLDTYHSERHPVGARVLKNTMALSALGRGDARTEALREQVTELLAIDEPRRRYTSMMTGLDVHYDLGQGHALLGRRMPDLDLETEGGARHVYSLLHHARPVLINFGDPSDLDIAAWADRVRWINARHEGGWELPAIGVVPAPLAVLIRPDGYVAWVGDGTDAGLGEALRTWFGQPG